MTKKELKRFSKTDLLELLLEQTKEIDSLRSKNEMLETELQNKSASISNIGSIAEATLKLNNIFEDAQAAADDFVMSVQNADNVSLKKEVSRIKTETRKICDEMILSASKESDKIIGDAKTQATNLQQKILNEKNIEIDELNRSINNLNINKEKIAKDITELEQQLEIKREKLLEDTEKECAIMKSNVEKECEGIRTACKEECRQEILNLKAEIDRRLSCQEK